MGGWMGSSTFLIGTRQAVGGTYSMSSVADLCRWLAGNPYGSGGGGGGGGGVCCVS